MVDIEIRKYKALNELAEQNGTVIFGGSEDVDIPLCELKQAFALNNNFYNRSVSELSVCNATDIYNLCIAELNPENILLHIGERDVKLCEEEPAEFESKFRELINQIRRDNKKCNVAIISLKNYDDAESITRINKNLKYIAESEQCEYCDISAKKVWNPKQTKEVVSFVYTVGFVHPIKNKRPLYDLVKMLFCSEI